MKVVPGNCIYKEKSIILFDRLHLLFLSHTWWLSWWLCPKGNTRPYANGGIGKWKFSLQIDLQMRWE